MAEKHKLGEAFALLTENGGALSLEVGDAFWERTIHDLPAGRLVSAFRTEVDWSAWEAHPAGEELILQLSGAMELMIEGETPIRLDAGEFVIVPAGAWHTANVITPGEALYITPGEGTASRPR